MNEGTPLSSLTAKVLIVDDERLNIKMLHSLLGSEYDIMVATSGADALQLAASQQPDLILLDILMPEMDGYEVCRRLKDDGATSAIPVIFITAKSDSDDETRGFDCGAVDYIAKPFNFSVVLARVRTHIRLKQRSDLLETLVLRDALTGIPNRRAFDQALAQEWSRCRRIGAPLGVIMMDVDHFKLYNDHYGHGAGDSCLIRVARALAVTARRPGDLIARYGGEEFCAVLPNLDLSGATAVAERLRSAVWELALPHEKSSVAQQVSISLGVSCVVPGDDVHMPRLVRAADQALYAAKAGGRNCAKGMAV